MKKKYFIIFIHQGDILAYTQEFVILHLIITHHKKEIEHSLYLKLELVTFQHQIKNNILHKPLIYWLSKLEKYVTITQQTTLFIRLLYTQCHNDYS